MTQLKITYHLFLTAIESSCLVTELKLNTSNPITLGETVELKSGYLNENRILNITAKLFQPTRKQSIQLFT
jgi:hypothetical protein